MIEDEVVGAVVVDVVGEACHRRIGVMAVLHRTVSKGHRIFHPYLFPPDVHPRRSSRARTNSGVIFRLRLKRGPRNLRKVVGRRTWRWTTRTTRRHLPHLRLTSLGLNTLYRLLRSIPFKDTLLNSPSLRSHLRQPRPTS